MSDTRSIHIPFIALGAATLWLVAIAFIAWGTLNPDTEFGRWGLLTSAAAASWTVIAGQCLGRRKLADTIVRKLEIREETARVSRI